MIELNCIYEESKKILELGYDFTRVCTKFECRDDDDMKVVYGEKVTENTIRNQYTVINNEPWFQGKAWCQGFIPIVPKAVLEACLPDIVDAYHGDLAWYIPRNPLEYRLCRDGDLVTSLLLEEFDSAYEAFIWCHEHHPEELKKKFEEVMK